MAHAKHGFKRFGLSLLVVLALMAVTAAGAQAAEEWLIEGARAPNNTPIHAAIHPLKDTGKKHIVFLTTVGVTPVEILCSELVSDDGLLIQNTLILILLLFKKCETIIKGVVSAACKPQEPIDMGLLGHLFLHGEEPKKLTYILFEADEKKPIATFVFGEECSIGEKLALEGTFVAECLSEKLEKKEETGIDYCLQELVHHLIQQAPEKLFPLDVLKFGANTALIDGILDLLLSGANLGRPWSGHV
jgi:hypothetical protein